MMKHTMNKKLVSIFIFLFSIAGLSITINTFAVTPEFNNEIIKNLHNRNYKERSLVNENIKSLSEPAASDAYKLSIVLLASAQQGDENFYKTTLLKMQTSLNAVTQNSYKTWLLGRLLLASDSIADRQVVMETESELTALLNDKSTAKDNFSAWAWGYLAAINNQDYKTAKKEMLAAANTLTEQYQQEKLITKDQKKLQGMLSDALWAWTMDAQAATDANDQETFNYILTQIKLVTGQKTIALALSTGLLRVPGSNDYPAWALGIVRLSAATIGDRHLYHELRKPLKKSIQDANTAMKSTDKNDAYSATAEMTLAELNLELGKLRWKQQLPRAKSYS